MVKTEVIVDGYNVLKTTPQFAQLQAQSLEIARDTLVNLLSAKAQQYDITVVFDAWQTEVSSERAMRVRGVRVVYTRQGERADDVIVRLAASANGHCIVVTRDNSVRRYAAASGCQLAEPEALLTTPKPRRPKAAGGPKDADDTDPTIRRDSKKGPSRRPKKGRRRPEWRL